MKLFVINSGSSSIKYQLIEMPSEKVVCSGIVERIGEADAGVIHKIFVAGQEKTTTLQTPIPDHARGLKEVASLLTAPHICVIAAPSEIDVVGHRVVHGGESFSATTLITPEVKEQIRKLFPLAPLHNPPNYLGIEVAEDLFSTAKQVAVFDTAFHQTIPEVAFRYAIPPEFYYDNAVRVYGFHGTSHKYVSRKAADYLQKKDAGIISIHLGNGCSMTAVRDGRSVDTSMGFGPMNGLIMGTRAGDIDQSVIFYLVDQLGYKMDQVKAMLNRSSGMTGLTGLNDMRDIKARIEQGEKQALLAYHMYAYRVRKYIGSYTAVLNGPDAIVFTGGVGENDRGMRMLCTQAMDYLGIEPDATKNDLPMEGLLEFGRTGSRVRLLAIATNEELEIATQCYQLLDG